MHVRLLSRPASRGRPPSHSSFYPAPGPVIPPVPVVPPPPSWPGPMVVERELAGVVGSKPPRETSRIVRFDDIYGDSSKDDVIIMPAKKSKAQMWRKVSSKKLHLEPAEIRRGNHYNGPEVVPGRLIRPGPPPELYWR